MKKILFTLMLLIVTTAHADRCPQPAGFHWEAVLDAKCNCYRTVLAPN